MMDPVTVRITALLEALSEDDRAALLARVGDDPAALSDPGRIRARAEAMPEADRQWLQDVLLFEAGALGILRDDGRRNETAESLGLVFFGSFDGRSDRLWIPLETRAALLDEQHAYSAPLVAILAALESDELFNIAQLHGVMLHDDAEDTIDASIAIAEVLLDIERLDGVFDSLPLPAKRLAHWLAEHEEPVPAEMATAKARRFAELAGDPTATSEAVLSRLGMVHELEVDGDRVLLIPTDLREALQPIIETALSEHCRQLYAQLRDNGIYAFRDEFPRGISGNPLHAARHRLLRAQALGVETGDVLDRVLTVFRTLDPTSGVGEMASIHLDVATPERFAQECLRSWLNSLDDDFTRILVGPFGGDCVALADWIFEREPGDPSAVSDAEYWSSFLYDLRAQLLFVLSVLPAGTWFDLNTLAGLMAAVYRRLMWHARGFHGLSEGAPEYAFPMPGVDVTRDEEAQLYEAMVILFSELFGPIGCASLDPTGNLFMVNPEALRAFRDGEPGFNTLWDEIAHYVGDDVELWLPMPTPRGTLLSGVSPLVWIDDRTVELHPHAHIYDLLRMNAWAEFDPFSAAMRFTFHGEQASTRDEMQRAEDMLLWLTIRSQGLLPDAIRTMFGGGDAPEDWKVDAARYAQQQLRFLEPWGDAPPLELMEHLRGLGGQAAGPVIVDQLAALVSDNAWEAPMLRHLSVLAGELGVVDAVPLLLRILTHSDFEPAEGAASVALARIGEPAIEGLHAQLSNLQLHFDKRIAAASTLSALSAVHRTLVHRVVAIIKSFAAYPEDVPEDVPTLVGIFVAEAGDPEAEVFLQTLQEQNLWMNEIMPFDEVLWIAGISPAVWGHPRFAAPLSHLYLPRSEAEAVLASHQTAEETPEEE